MTLLLMMDWGSANYFLRSESNSIKLWGKNHLFPFIKVLQTNKHSNHIQWSGKRNSCITLVYLGSRVGFRNVVRTAWENRQQKQKTDFTVFTGPSKCSLYQNNQTLSYINMSSFMNSPHEGTQVTLLWLIPPILLFLKYLSLCHSSWILKVPEDVGVAGTLD